MKVLAGYPLALEVVLPNLKSQSPSQILEALQAADFDLDSGSEDKTKSILKCVEYSHSNLSPDAQRLLICLAPFTGFIHHDFIPNYAEELQKLEPFQDYDFANFDAAIQEAINWGLLERMDESNGLLTIQPIFPYFLKTKLASLDEATCAALQEGFKAHYQDLAGFYNQLMESKDPQERQLGIFFCRLEYENLYKALQICLANKESIDIFFCLIKYFDLLDDIQNRLVFAQSICNELKHYPNKFRESKFGCQIGFAFHRLARSYQENKQYEQAKVYYHRTLEAYEYLCETEEREKKIWSAPTYHQMGRLSQNLRDYGEAGQNYQRSLEIFIEFEDLDGQAKTYHQLGMLNQNLRNYEEARQNYQQSLNISITLKDRNEQAKAYHQLGIVAQELREYDKACQNYLQALNIFIEFNNLSSQSSVCYQLGTIAIELREYDKARQNFQQALSLKLKLNDRYSQSLIYYQLGIVAEELQEYKEARHNLQQALAICIEFDDQYNQAKPYQMLGIVARKLREYAEARQNHQKALAIYIEFGDHYSQASIYFQLGKVAEELGEMKEAKANYLLDLQITSEFNDEHGLGISLRNLERFYQATQDQSLGSSGKIKYHNRV